MMRKKYVVSSGLQEFVAGRDECVPTRAHVGILRRVRLELHPPALYVFTKLLVMQAVMGIMTLLFCPQFELSLSSGIELLHHFHHVYGASVCALVCGAIFTAPGAVVSAYLLKAAEVREVKRAGVRYHLGIAVIALLIFYLCGGDVLNQLTPLWLTAAVLNAMLLFEFNLRPRAWLSA